MRIGNYKLESNVRLPLHIIEYLQKRYEALESYLENKYGDRFDIDLDFSRQSESAYLTISEKWEPGKGFCSSVEISFRNHDNFAGSNYDEAIFLSHYETWTECKKYFLNERLPQILSKLQGDKAC
ncbi:hypothetical protein DCC39_18050 [Pueribacillus theae]|uniref:Uncharacterized protein n=1 Tax=Pueribacillus theae TaxID=2171751 RepID=A0A2U1JKI0_9BACI|nr:hypothetical protein [Pueribacillus theae]PWA05489.1 hypothetical protein DCC39_18050 [Pueribacillus theae]